MKRILTLGIITASVIACSIIALLLIFTTRAELFYLNLAVIIAAELIILFCIPIVTGKSLLTFRKAATANLLSVYAILAVLWTAIYSTFIESQEQITSIYIGLCVLTGLFIFLIGFTELGASAAENRHKAQLTSEECRKLFMERIRRVWLDVLLNLSPTLQQDSSVQMMKQQIERLSILPVSHFNGDDTEKLENIEKLIGSISEDLSNLDKECTSVTQEISESVERLRQMVVFIK